MPIPLRRLLWPKSLAGKAIVILAFMFGVLAGSLFTAQHFVAKRLAAAWRLNEELGLSNDVNELLGSRVPDDRNATVPLDGAAAIAAEFMIAIAQKHNLKLLDDGVDRTSNLPELDSLMGDVTYESLLQKSDELTEYRSPLIPADRWAASSFKHLSNRSRLFEAEKGMALRLAANGRREEAIQQLLRLSRITRKWESKEPFMISCAVSVGGRGKIIAAMNTILRTGDPLQAAIHDAIEDEFAKYEDCRSTALWLGHTETLLELNEFEQYRGRHALLLGDLAWDVIVTKTLVHTHRINKTWDKLYVESAEVFKAVNREDTEFRWSPVGRLIGGPPTTGNVFHIRNTFDRLLARARCLRIVNAWSRRGDFALELDSLNLPAAVLDDPFDGKRLRVKRTPQGPIVYSVGHDLTDNNGDVGDKPSDQGLGPIGFKSDTP